MPRRLHAVTLISFAFVALAGFSQDPARPQQGRPVELLAVFEGTWGREGISPDKFRETCEWLAGGRRHLVCSTYTQPAPAPAGMIRIHSYRNPNHLVYVAIGDGPALAYVGGPEGDRWIFNLEPQVPGGKLRLRQIVTPTKDRIRFVEEASENGEPWKVTEDYSYVRLK